MKKGRPDLDFTILVLVNVANGSDMGDICHSIYFVGKFILALEAAMRRRWREVLGAPMLATGCRPPVNVMADKATHQRETWQAGRHIYVFYIHIVNKNDLNYM